MSDAQIAVRPKASQQLANLIGMEQQTMLDTIKAQCFKTDPRNVSDAQLAAFVSIAAAMEVNPLLPGMLYAYPNQGGIIPIMGPDGIYKKLSERDDIDSWEVEVLPPDVAMPPTHAIARIWRKGREKPLSYTALLSEWKVDSNPNWKTRPRHMLSLRALKHCARQIIHGLPGDEDDRAIMEINVTPGAEAQADTMPKRTTPPKREAKGAAAVQENTDKKSVIDVSATPVAGSTPPQSEAKQTEPTTEKRAELVAPPVTAPAQEAKAPATPPPAEKPAPAATTTGPRTSLKVEETIQAKVKIKKFWPMTVVLLGVPTPSVQSEVEGDYVGKIYHFNGATLEGNGLVALPIYKEGVVLNMELFGRLNTKTGQVMTVVQKIAQEGPANTPVEEF